MFIKINGNEYELSTKLGISVKIEKKFKLPLTQVLEKISSAEINELVDIVTISANKINDGNFKKEILDNWDYTDLQSAVQELLARLMFSGDDEEVKTKIEKYPVGEKQKNLIRRMLGISPEILSEQPTDVE
ncbi:MAG: hypothetical protein K2G63_03390 [Oscillospiraceae bacterium]|nr:hypothetical protein [Oscillospiraceae bacterium]